MEHGPNLTPYVYLLFDGLFLITLIVWAGFSFIFTYHWLHYSPQAQTTRNALFVYFSTSILLLLGLALFWLQFSA